MKRAMKRLTAAFLCTIMCLSMFGTYAFAETQWNGEGFSIDVKQGSEEYQYLSVYKNPGSYEMSSHMLSPDGGASNDIPQTLIMVEADRDYTWVPDGYYTFGESNYEVLYCCDAEVGYKDGVYYKRSNLEDSDYYDEEEAAHIRGIITNSYPFVSLERMKKNLKKEGFKEADALTRADVIAAVQAAVWAYANDDVGEYEYSQTFNVTTNTQWGTPFHDFMSELDSEWQELGKRKVVKDDAVAARINALTEHLKQQKEVYATKYQVVINQVEITHAKPIIEKDGSYTVEIDVDLNNGGSSKKDNIILEVYVGDKIYASQKVDYKKDKYKFRIEDYEEGQTIVAKVSGTQVLPKGVYFYEPEGGRTVSQSLVGVAEGETEVSAEASVTLEPSLKYGFLILKKVDEKGKALTGVSFDLYRGDAETGEYVGTYSVNEKGKALLENIAPGEYELVESQVPEGYLAPTERIQFTVDENGKVHVTESKSLQMKGDTLTVTNRPPNAAVVLTIDMSGTMYNNTMNKKKYVDVAKEKAIVFVEKYADSSNNNGKRMVAVVCFDTDAQVKQNWIDVSTEAGKNAAIKAIDGINVADNGDTSSNQVCTNFDGGIILTRNLLKSDTVKEIDRTFAIILSDGAPTVTVNSDTDTVGTIKSSFWGNQLDASGKKYQNARAGGGWTHPAEVERTLTYMATGDNTLMAQTCQYTVNGEKKEGIFIVGVGGLMDNKLFNDAVYGTNNGTRTDDVKKNPNAFNHVDALADYSSSEIMKLTTGDWMNILAGKVNGTYVSAANETALADQFNVIINAIKDTTSK